MKNLKVSKIKELSKDYPVIVLYIVGNLLNPLLLRLFTTGRFQVRSMFFDIGFVVLLVGLSFLVKEKRRKFYYMFSTILMVATCVTNSLYYNYYESFISFSLLATSVFVKDVGDAVTQMVIRPCDLSYLWLIVGMIIAFRMKKEKIILNKKKFLIPLGLAVVMMGIGCAMPPYNSFMRLYKFWNRVTVLDSWGPYIYQVDDLIQSLKPKFNNIFGYDKALKDTKDYYSENKKTLKANQYTGIFEGKNVIAIHAESLQDFTLGLEFNGNEVTPNINRLVKTGIYFDNFYAQVGVGTSSDTEFTYSSSLLPSNNGTVFVNYYNDHFITMQNLLKDKGYYVFSMHGNVGDFWNRNAMHINMGYDKMYDKSSFVIDEEYGLGLSDASFFRQVVPMIKDINDNVGKPYYGTLITLTNHTPWPDVNKYDELDLGIDEVIDGEIVHRDYLNTTIMGRYLKSVNYMDKAIGSFLDDMDKEGLLDNTVIIIYGDHDARIPKNQYEYMYNYDPVTDEVYSEDDENYTEFNEYDYELSKNIPLIIWTKEMTKGVEIDTPMGMIDALPTIGNMLNVYNKYALGKDIMSIKNDEGIIVFKDGSFITDKVYYNAKSNESYMISSSIIESDYISKRSEYADKLIEISNNIITYDLINKLD